MAQASLLEDEVAAFVALGFAALLLVIVGFFVDVLGLVLLVVVVVGVELLAGADVLELVVDDGIFDDVEEGVFVVVVELLAGANVLDLGVADGVCGSTASTTDL